MIKITEKDSNIFLESEELRVVIEPFSGGKISSFFDKAGNTEWFFQDFRKQFSPEKGFSYHDLSGFDECFPTVAACEYSSGPLKGLELGDHGLLWQKEWNTKVDLNKVITCCDIPELQCHFERVCRFETPSCLRLDYTILNFGQNQMPFIYSAHSFLNATKTCCLELPKRMRDVYIYVASENSGFKSNTWIKNKVLKEIVCKKNLSAKKESFVKFFSDKLRTNSAGLHNLKTGKTLTVEFDHDHLPHLGVLVNEGYDGLGDGDFKGKLLVALEPTTSIGDDIQTAEKTQTLKTIPAGESVKFWIKIDIKKD